MSTELATTPDLTNLPSTQFDDSVFDDLAKASDFLPRLQLYSKGKAIDKGKVRPGSYGIPMSKDDITDLGNSIDVLVLTRKPKAIDMGDTEAIISVYDPNSDEFKRIAAKSAERDSHCMYGVTFLVFERSTGKFLEFFCGTKSSRGEAGKLYQYMPLSQNEIDAKGLEGVEAHGPLPVTLKSKLVEKGSFSWFVPVVQACSTPIELPEAARVINEIHRFIAVKAPEVEKAPEQTGSRRAR